ncbi:unnamed protein product [Lactuca saligna]|uniref:Uncharacterized protein n=1 Tax=Lactuca saligna TaxID=75948 RepID=A0AA36EBJ9_LACSI|nr:unnamed protein product [Lactuca saligna]
MLYYYLPYLNCPKGLSLIQIELDYDDFIAIVYECGCEIPMYVNHFHNTNIHEWLDEESDEVLDNIQEEVFDDKHVDVEIGVTWRGDDNSNSFFFKNDNGLDFDMCENVGQVKHVDEDMGKNEIVDAHVDLPSIFNEGVH